jgi:hypothetical protein
MDTNRRLMQQYVITIALLAMLVLLATRSTAPTPHAAAQAGNGYDLTWYTIDNGGGTSAAGDYTLMSTIGQPDVRWILEGGGYTLGGGFWGSGARQYKVYLPLVLHSP